MSENVKRKNFPQKQFFGLPARLPPAAQGF